MKYHKLTIGTLLLVATFATTGCTRHHKNNLPPAKMLMEPGPGVGGPGPGVMLNGLPTPVPFNVSQLAFNGPPGLRISWDSTGDRFFDAEPLVAPARQNFPQGAIYRLKVSNVPGRPGEEYYPSVEVGPTTPRTEAYLAHNAVPIQFTAQDFDQVQSGNFVTKVIYLPDPEYQELALAAIETLVSTRLDPGVDPVKEADRRGSILAIIRLGNKDLAAAGVPGEARAEMRGVRTVGYQAAMMGGGRGLPAPHPMLGMSPSHVAGVTAPQYGHPMVGTPIGLPGPPHVPLGIPAGLQHHSITNKTCIHMPQPTQKIHIGVEQKPGMSYPRPPSRAHIVEEASHDRFPAFRQPFRDMFEWNK